MNRIMVHLVVIVLAFFTSVYGRRTTNTVRISNKQRSGISTLNSGDISIETYNQNQPLESLLNKLLADPNLPDGVTITKLSVINGTNEECGIGSYTDFPSIDNITLGDGIILSTGDVIKAAGPNSSLDLTSAYDYTNNFRDFELENIVNGMSANSSSFEIEFTCDSTVEGLSFDFCFGSEEFPDFVGLKYNDVFAAFLDDENIVFDKNGKLISVNNSFFDVDNYNTDSVNLEFNGLTSPLRTSKRLTPGKHVLRFAIADIGDALYDSGVFISKFSFTYTGEGTKKIEEDERFFFVSEHTAAGSEVGVINLKKSAATLELLSQSPSSDFNLSGKTIVVADGKVLDYESVNTYKLKMAAHLSGFESDTFDVTINITDEIEIENFADDQVFYVPEDLHSDSVAALISLKNSEADLELIYQTPSSDFKLLNNSLYLKDWSSLDYENISQYFLKMAAHLSGFESDTFYVTVNVVDKLELMDINSATLYDRNGDGRGDSVKIYLSEPFQQFTPDELEMSFPDGSNTKKISLNEGDVLGKSPITLTFSALSGNIATGGEGTVEFLITSPEKASLTGVLKDGMGPLLLDSVSVREGKESKRDTLFLLFSENIRYDISGESLILLRGNIRSELTVESVLGNNDNSFIVTVDSKVGPIENGDSISINYAGPIKDLENNSAHRDNTPVPVKIYVPPFGLKHKVIEIVDPTENLINEKIPDVGFTMKTGIPIILEPTISVESDLIDEVECSLRIVDYLGNTLANVDSRDAYSEHLEIRPFNAGNPMIAVVWSGKNRNNRRVSSGTYLGLLAVKYPDGREELIKIPIPVQRLY